MERVLRTRRRQLGADEVVRRRLVTVPIEYRVEELAVFDGLRALDVDGQARARVRQLSASSWAALATDAVGLSEGIRARLAPIREARVDAKLEALLDLCARLWREDPRRKLVVRCEYSPTLDLVADRLATLLARGGLRDSTDEEIAAWSSEDDGGVGPVARLDGGEDSMLEALAAPELGQGSMLAQLAAFERHDPGAALVLVAKDVAAVGLNLQFARDLVFYDLPWRVGLTEQWMGRLDRLGQRAREVNVYALTNPDSPTQQLLDLYRALRLFDAAGRAQDELDQHVATLIQRADDDQLDWREVIERARRAFDEAATDHDAGSPLDLEVRPGGLTPVAEHDAGLRALRAFKACGLELDEQDGGGELRWPGSKTPDHIELREIRAHLRRDQHRYGGSDPRAHLMRSEVAPTLRVDPTRLSAARWSRPGATDFLTPRHPLIVEAYDELMSDPTLAVASLRVPRPAPTWAPATFVLALCRSYPTAAGAALAWQTGALEAIEDEDEELRAVFSTIEGGLRRACAAAAPPRSAVIGWQLSGPHSAARPLTVPECDALVEVLSRGEAVAPQPSAATRCAELFEETERSGRPDDDGARAELAPIVDTASRHAALLGAPILRDRAKAARSLPAGGVTRPLRERHERRLAAAQAFFERLATLGADLEPICAELTRMKVVAGALLEVTR